ARPWTAVAASHRRALRAVDLVARPNGGDPVDADEHLVTLVLGADLDAVRDLRAQVLEPLAGLRPAARDRLVETLRSWLLHQGRRDAVAADLNVHAQTVRYRMTQLRELYGDRLLSPDVVLQLVVALAIVPPDVEP
ncbi:MAG: PucR family transcriptional regulator, partial [Acidimicrobiales bacterium]|nr:PucR family transcriptional regulator [Acidimicrobiales bacterium]